MSYLISIIIPTYNRLELLRETVISVLNQKHRNWECIVVDDGSYDETDSYMFALEEKDQRFKYIKRPSQSAKGASSCRNIGFLKSKGEYIQYLDSDDLLSPQKLEKQILSLNGSKKFIASCDWSLFSENPEKDSQKINLPLKNKKYNALDLLETLGSVNQFLPPHCYLTPRDLIDKAGGWDESLTNNDDAEFFSRVLFQSNGIMHLPETLVYYRKSFGTNLSNYSDPKKIKSAIKSWHLIEETYKTNNFKKESIYIKNAKTRLYNTTKNKYPLLIKENKTFFNGQLESERFRLNPIFVFKKHFKNKLRKAVGEFKKIALSGSRKKSNG